MSLPYWLGVGAAVALGVFGAFVVVYDRSHALDTSRSPGWYLDPQGSGLQRQWDGVAWGEQLVPRPIGILTGARMVAFGIVMAIALLAVIGWLLR